MHRARRGGRARRLAASAASSRCGSRSRGRAALGSVRRAAETGPFALDERLPGRAQYVTNVGKALGRLDEANREHGGVRCGREDRVGLRVVRRARPISAAIGRANRHCGVRTADLADHGRQKHGAQAIGLQLLQRLTPERRREIDHFVLGHRLSRVGRRLRREGLRRRGLLAGHVALGNGTLFDRPDGLSCHAVEDIQERFLAGKRDGFDGPAVNRDVCQNRRRREIVIPDRMVDDLEVPLLAARLQVHADEALTVQIVTRPMTAIEIGRGRLNGQVDQAQVLVN